MVTMVTIPLEVTMVTIGGIHGNDLVGNVKCLAFILGSCIQRSESMIVNGFYNVNIFFYAPILCLALFFKLDAR